jgi:hypothetical protein
MGILASILPDPGRVCPDIAGIAAGTREGRTRYSSTALMARAARAGSAAFESTAQDCAIESIRHSAFSADPSGVPSSK